MSYTTIIGAIAFALLAAKSFWPQLSTILSPLLGKLGTLFNSSPAASQSSLKDAFWVMYEECARANCSVGQKKLLEVLEHLSEPHPVENA